MISRGFHIPSMLDKYFLHLQVLDHNAKHEGWEMELNMFADMTEEEKNSYTGLNVSQVLESMGPVEEETFPQFLSNPSCKC